MFALDKAVFTIDTNYPGVVDVVLSNTRNGVEDVSKKSIGYADFMGIVNETLEFDSRIELGKIPEGYYNCWMDSDSLGFRCLIIIDEGVKPIQYYESVFMVPFPALVFDFTVRMGVLKDSKVYALASSKPSMRDILYKYPYGNVHTDGKICWGMNVVDGIRKVKELETVISKFFGCETNDDLWDKDCVCTKDENQFALQRGLLEFLNSKKDFPKDLLAKRTETFKSLMKDSEDSED